MASLTGTKVSDTYQQLLKLTSQGVGADASAKYVEDGLGTDTALSLSTTRVGIGTAIPGSLLEVKGTGETQIYINSASGNNSGVRFLENGANKWTIGHDQSDDSLFFYDFGATATRFSIDSSGDATFAGNITQSKAGNLRHSLIAGGSGEAVLLLQANNSTGDSFIRWETNATTFSMGFDNSDSDKFILSAGSDPHSNSVINIQPDGSSIAVDKPISFGGTVSLLDVAQSIDFIQSGAINFDSNGDQTGRVLTIGSNRTGDSGGTTNVTFEESGNTIFSGDAKVGFGAGTPGAQVEIRDDDTTQNATSYHEILRINNQTGNASDRTAMIGFSSYNTGGNTAYCGARSESSGAQTAFEIGVHSGATLEERFRIASDSHTTVNITSTPTGANQPSQKIQFRGYHANTGDGKRTFAKIQGQKHNNTGGAVGGDLLFFTNDTSNNLTERIRIDETGAVMFNTTSRTATGVGGATFDPNSVGRAVLNLGSVNYTSELDLVRLYNDNGEVGDIRTNGSGASFNSNSDYRLKENEVALSNALQRLNNLKPYRFNFKADPSTTLDGFFAHEVQEVVPEAVTGTKDQMMPIQYQPDDDIPEGKQVYDVKEYSTTEIEAQKMDASKLVPLLVAALQEADNKIDALTARLDDLEPEEPEQEQSPTVKERVNSLEARVNDLENG